MQIAYCENCGKHTGHKRAIGVGTALGAVVTGGASLLAVPAYGKRCVICGLTTEQAHSVSPAAIAVREVRRQQAAKDVVALVKLPFQLIALLLKGFWWLSKQIGKGMLRIDTAIRARNAAQRKHHNKF